MGTIPRIVAHLELDGAGVATGPPLGEHEEREFVEQRLEALGQRARRRVPGRVPEGPDGEEGVAIVQAQRRHAGARRRAAHDEADEVVGEEQAPDLLRHAGGGFAAQRFDAFAGVGLEFVEGEFEFPALVVERGKVRGRVGGGGAEGGEDPIGAEAAALDADGADAERPGRSGCFAQVAGLGRNSTRASPGPKRWTTAWVRAVGPLRARTIQCRSRFGVARVWKSA